MICIIYALLTTFVLFVVLCLIKLVKTIKGMFRK